MIDRVHRELAEGDIRKIAETYHAWRGTECKKKYEDIRGFCNAANIEDIRHHHDILTPGRYVDAAVVEEDDEPFEDKIKRMIDTLSEQMNQAVKLDQVILANLEDIGCGV